jgi:hypothetical protein
MSDQCDVEKATSGNVDPGVEFSGDRAAGRRLAVVTLEC